MDELENPRVVQLRQVPLDGTVVIRLRLNEAAFRAAKAADPGVYDDDRYDAIWPSIDKAKKTRGFIAWFSDSPRRPGYVSPARNPTFGYFLCTAGAADRIRTTLSDVLWFTAEARPMSSAGDWLKAGMAFAWYAGTGVFRPTPRSKYVYLVSATH